MTLIMEYFLLLLVMKYRILIQIYIIKIQTIWNGRIVKENYWIKNNFTDCNCNTGRNCRYWQRQKKLSRMKRGVVTMEYIAHKDNERVQTVKEHLYGTAELAGFFAERFGKKEWGYCCGMLHDLGKYSKEFQRKIRNDTGERVDHSTAGAESLQ